MGELKRLCRDQIETSSIVAECDKVYGHKGRHHCQYREGRGDRYVDITVRWPRKRKRS